MCGISGFIKFKKDLSSIDLEKFGINMSRTLFKRGPDSYGSWVDSRVGVSLSHRRLSIFDITNQGLQPRISNNKRFVIVYNGELYNFLELKDKLINNNIKFNTKCDTEVVIEAISFWGLREALNQFNGMFAFSLWDRDLKKMYLIRDRVGIKPLFVYFDGENLAFASEIKALRELPWLTFEIDRESVASFVRLNYIPTPNSIYKNISKIEPGSFIEISLNKKIVTKKYWSLSEYIKKIDKIDNSDQDLITEKTLTSSVRKQMQADVPIGVFLSGGIDSSLIACLAQKISEKRINTFTIGFDESKFDEALYAKDIANKIGTNHHEEYFSTKELKKLMNDIPKAYDEPFADSSQLPTLLLSKVTSEKVKVALSGDGGDELYGGYYRYFLAEKYKRLIFRQPRLFKSILTTLINFLPINFWNIIGSFLPNKFGGKGFGDKLFKLMQVLEEDVESSFQKRIISNYHNLKEILHIENEKNTIIFDKKLEKLFPSMTERMQLIDFITYLPDDILSKVDRASMFYSLEVRVPFLDNKVIEEAWKIPEFKKIKKGEGKIILKKILSNFLPNDLFNRPKMGFGIPLDKILTNNLRDDIEYFLNSYELKKQNLFKLDEYKKKWIEHLSGSRNWQFLFWNFLVFNIWFDHWEKKL